MGNFFSYHLLIAFIVASLAMNSQITVNAGLDKTICPGTTTTIGGSPTVSGGSPPYTISWSPSTGLSSASASNPTVTATASITYTISVKDSKDSTGSDIVTVLLDNISLMNAGPDASTCLQNNQAVTLGSGNNYATPYTFLWAPAASLSSVTDPKPVATPTVTTTYTVLITSPVCGVKTDMVTVSVHNLDISAGADTSLLEGETIQLHASPYDTTLTYYWSNNGAHSITYPLTYNPDVSPMDTTIYYLIVTDAFGCQYYDNVTVYVLKNTDLVFYNSITPNGDGENDNWIIGNLEKYPSNKLQIFNRYGQEIYSVTNYKNDWNGKYLGQNLPGGTYYYLFDTKTEKGKFKGSITIYR